MKNQEPLINPAADKQSLQATMKAMKKNTHGGARAGAGRKRQDTEARRSTMAISGTETELETIRQLAKDAGKTTSRFLIELALKPEAFFTKFLANIICCPMCIHYDLEQFECTHGSTDCYNHIKPGSASTCPFFVLIGSKTEKGY